MQHPIDSRFGVSSPRLADKLLCDLTDDCPYSSRPFQTKLRWSWLPLGLVQYPVPSMYTDREWLTYCCRFIKRGDSAMAQDKALLNHPARKILNALRGRVVRGLYSLEFIELDEGCGMDEGISNFGLLVGKCVEPVSKPLNGKT